MFYFLLVKTLACSKMVRYIENYSLCGNVPFITSRECPTHRPLALVDKPHQLLLWQLKHAHRSPKCLLRVGTTSKENHWFRLFSCQVLQLGRNPRNMCVLKTWMTSARRKRMTFWVGIHQCVPQGKGWIIFCNVPSHYRLQTT